MKPHFQIAQVNLARVRAALDDRLLAGFVANLEQLSALADSSPGFVWRLTTDAGGTTLLRTYADQRIMINLSVWATPEHLREFVYRTAHADVMRQRAAWFERFEGLYYALWWIPAGHTPSIGEATDRLEHLRSHGECAYAFTFAKLFPAPDPQGLR